MFDGFSSLLKPENTSEFSPRFSVSFSRSRRNEFSPSSLQVASGENFWGFYEAIEKSRGNRKKLVVAMLWGDGGLRSAAVEIRGPSTQYRKRAVIVSDDRPSRFKFCNRKKKILNYYRIEQVERQDR